ncbi:CPBP family intramembrane glutamic endopeptidase [Erythrobacter sp.]|uniref:CPBP family intramembrane glutamic endopeptidase, BDIM_20840 family n=1 Tax=Erythrobacter sp. TaxID=1042 RepID=UPI0025E861B1|nr:CPBP family intramembrane glutamic endopeptidase [Erythrobacter sp.]
MSDQITAIVSICGILILVGTGLGLADRKNFSPGWLVVATALVFANDAMLTRVYGLIPDLLPDSDWNWQGKLMALVLSLGVAALGLFGWRRSGLTLRQHPGSLRSAAFVFAAYILFFLVIALAFDAGDATAETVAFQLTMPGLEEEIFYRGILLLALNEAFRGRIRLLGINWGWGALLSSLVFGLAHAFSYSAGEGFAIDPVYLALTAIPSLLAVWLRERTGSLLLPIAAHNFGNALPLML